MFPRACGGVRGSRAVTASASLSRGNYEGLLVTQCSTCEVFLNWPFGCLHSLTNDDSLSPPTAHSVQRSQLISIMDCHHESPTRDHMDIVKVVTPRYDDESSTDNRDKICAYFKLIFPNFQLFAQNTSVTIGRRSVRSDGPSTSEIPQCDVDLGPLKSVSRFHAKIEYEDNEERFVLVVLGRNGAWVDGIWSGSGSRVPLGSR